MLSILTRNLKPALTFPSFIVTLAYRHCIMSVMPTLVTAPVALAMYCITVFVKQRTADRSEFCSTHPRVESVVLSKTHYILITNLMHWFLFIHKIIFSSTCFELQVLIFRRIQLYTSSIWYCHPLWKFLVASSHSSCVPTRDRKSTRLNSSH